MGADRSSSSEQIVVALLGIPRLLRHPVWRDAHPEQGAGLGVLLVPGFGFGDLSLRLAATWLRDPGYRPTGARTGLNVGCTTELVERLEARLEEHARATGGPVVLFGQSRGGGPARLVAVRRPDLVRGLVMLGSPVLDPLGAHPKIRRVSGVLARLSAAGLPGLLNQDCLSGSCYDRSIDVLAAPLRVPAISVHSRNDRIAPSHLCLDPFAACVEVRSTHTGMGLDPEVYAVLAPEPAAWAAGRSTAEGLRTPGRRPRTPSAAA